ncbi:MAG: DNA repair protein RecO [Nitrospiraceae bacterium]|nr:DNA repair protein RecO [Nitrospiraceae bacterium]MDA8325682.1 DNA repair protein RecO [Nitrospiraceae bacterium]
MLGRTEGIVLRSRPLGEADLIVEYLTRDFGIRPAFAKSPRKIKSRFGGSLEPFTHARISLLGREDANLPRLTQSDIIRPFQILRENSGGFVQACGLAGLVLKLLPERETAGAAGTFELLLWGLDGLEKQPGSAFVPLVFKLRVLALAGYAPSLNGCARCGRQSEIFCFYPRDGAILCENCKKDGPAIKISAALKGLHKSLSEFPLDKLARIKPGEALLSELRAFVDMHFREGANIALKPARPV